MIEIHEKDWIKFRKRPIVIKAVQMTKDFEIETIEGTMKGRAGDYLIKGIRGELYPCRKDIFFDTYDEVNRCQKKK